MSLLIKSKQNFDELKIQVMFFLKSVSILEFMDL